MQHTCKLFSLTVKSIMAAKCFIVKRKLVFLRIRIRDSVPLRTIGERLRLTLKLTIFFVLDHPRISSPDTLKNNTYFTSQINAIFSDKMNQLSSKGNVTEFCFRQNSSGWFLHGQPLKDSNKLFYRVYFVPLSSLLLISMTVGILISSSLT